MTSVPTYVFEVVGDLEEVEAALAGREGVYEVDVTPLDGGGHADQGYCVVRGEICDLERAVRETVTRGSLVTIPPVVYEGDEASFHVLRPAPEIQAAVREAREALPVTIERIGEDDRPSERETAALTDRQRAALEAGLDVGYYDVLLRATHDDVAEQLDCAPSTASEHLEKGEAALVRELLG